MSTDLKLYEIAPAIAAIADQDDFTEEDLKALDELNLALEEKAGNIAALTDTLDNFIALCDSEEKRIKARKSAAKNKVKWFNEYVKYGMMAAGIKKIDCGTRTFTLQNNPPKLVVDDETAIPGKYFIIIPETMQVDKAEIKKALKDGDVPGVHLEQGQSVRKR